MNLTNLDLRHRQDPRYLSDADLVEIRSDDPLVEALQKRLEVEVAGGICILKEAAQQIKESHHE